MEVGSCRCAKVVMGIGGLPFEVVMKGNRVRLNMPRPNTHKGFKNHFLTLSKQIRNGPF